MSGNNVHRRPPIMGLAEVVLWVRDIRKSLEFYRDILDFPVQVVGDGKALVITASHPEYADFAQNIVLFEHPNPPQEWPQVKGHKAGPRTPNSMFYHLALAIDIAHYGEHLEWFASQGVEVTEDLHRWAGERSIYLHDPDGHLIELVAEDPELIEEEQQKENGNS